MPLLQSKNRTGFGGALLSGILLFLITLSAQAQDWKAIKVPIDETITGIHFPTPLKGYFVTSGGKYGVSVNGGRNWDVFQIRGQASLEDVFFKSKDSGLAVGRHGKIFRTIDGAQTWEDRSLKDSLPWLTSAVFVTDTIALATGLLPGTNLEGVLYRSIDGGRTWTKVEIKGLGFGELFVGKGVPVCFQSFGRLNYSIDNGATWQSLETGNGKPGRATAFYNNTGVICGNEAMCAFSHDRGKTWTQVPLEGGAALTSAVLVDDSLGYVAGTGGIVMVTEDGGRKWKKEPPVPEAVDIAKLAIAGNRLFAAGAAGFIFWKPIPKR